MTYDLTRIDDESRNAGVDRPKQFLLPHSGEVIDLASPSDKLAQALDEIRQLESRLKEAKGEVGGELLSRMDRARNWTMREGDYELRAPSDAPKEEWDTDRLVAVLTSLVDLNVIDAAAMDAAVEQVLTWKVHQRGLNALRKNPELREAIEGCRSEVPNERRYVSVKRAAA